MAGSVLFLKVIKKENSGVPHFITALVQEVSDDKCIRLDNWNSLTLFWFSEKISVKQE